MKLGSVTPHFAGQTATALPKTTHKERHPLNPIGWYEYHNEHCALCRNSPLDKYFNKYISDPTIGLAKEAFLTLTGQNKEVKVNYFA